MSMCMDSEVKFYCDNIKGDPDWFQKLIGIYYWGAQEGVQVYGPEGNVSRYIQSWISV